MKKKYIFIYLSILTIIFVIIAVLYTKNNKKIDWHPYFEKNKTTPYGSKLVYDNLPSIFTHSKIKTINMPIYSSLNDSTAINTNYIFICKNFDIDNLDMRSLLNYVANGNNVFISAEDMNFNFQDTIGCSFHINYNSLDVRKNNIEAKATYKHKILNQSLSKPSEYFFKRMIFPSDIEILDTYRYKVLIVDQDKKPVFVSTQYGNGHIYLHSYPYAFTNYYLLYKNNQEYISKCLSVLPNTTTYWDEYYKRDHLKDGERISPIKFILSTPALKWAWYLTLLALLLYVLFRVKRQQRIIPIIKPFENSSLIFIKTVGRLYFNKGDHRDIIKKQISYWLEYIRTKLFINTQKLDNDFIQQVADRSGISKDKIEDIIYAISDMRNHDPSKKDVINFFKKLDYFYKNSKR